MDFDTWQRNKSRPQFVRAHREELADALSDGVVDDLPAPGASTYEYRQFLNSHMGTVTRQLNPENGGDN